MRTLARRLSRLESAWQATHNPSSVYRIVFSPVFGRPNLEKCKCNRTISNDGTLLEFVRLDGSANELSDAELDEFVSRFPVQAAGRYPQ